MKQQVAIIGGGICGLSIGWRLQQAGIETVIYEKDKAGRAASWAAAGMLSPQTEAEPTETHLLPLMRESLDLWPAFARELSGATNIPLNLKQDGALTVAVDRDDAEKLEFQFKLQQKFGFKPEMLSGYDARKREPSLSRTVTAALFSPQDAQVDNRAVTAALHKAYVASGGKLHENADVTGIICADKVSGVAIKGEIIPHENVVVAAGAWSRSIQGIPHSLLPPVRPIKGQMIALAMNDPLISRQVWSPRIYIVPQPGRLLLGATVEEMGFDTTITAGGMKYLLEEAFDVLPGIYDLPVAESWAGLRPGSRDDAPILGATPVKGLIFATGHHRNGFLLLPATAQSICDLIVKGAITGHAKEFAISRFAA